MLWNSQSLLPSCFDTDPMRDKWHSFDSINARVKLEFCVILISKLNLAGLVRLLIPLLLGQNYYASDAASTVPFV